MMPPARDPVAPASVVRAAIGRETLDEVLAAVRDRLRRRYEASGVLLTRSGTHALTLALWIAGRVTGSEQVALPAYGCYAVATAAVGAGSRVRFYDLDPASLAADPGTVEEALHRGARTFVFAHLYGHPAVDDGLLSRIRDSGALLVEDAAQAAGGALEGRTLGSLGDLTVLSFGRGKGITCGRGGALLVRGSRVPDEVFDEVRRSGAGGWPARASGWAELGLTAAQWALGRPSLYRVPAVFPFLELGETRYREPTPPEPIADRAARLLRRALPAGPDPEVAGRRRRARRLADLLEPVPGIRPVRPLPGADSGALRLPFRVPAGRDGCPALGVLRGYPRLLPDLGVVERPPAASAPPTPGAAELRDALRTAPTHALVEDRDLRSIARWAGGRAPSAAPDAAADPAAIGDSHLDGTAATPRPPVEPTGDRT